MEHNKQIYETHRTKNHVDGYRREGMEDGQMGKEGQLYRDGWKVTFGGKHAVGHTEVEIQSCT